MELFSDLPGDQGLPGQQRRLAMLAVMTATTMAVFDGSIINIALPQIARALAVPSDAVIWVANGYLLAVAMCLASCAALAKRVGFRTLFALGMTLFTLASLGCALSPSLAWLTSMRVLQGIGGAATLSIAPAILRTIFPQRLLGRILGIHALLIAASTAIAPLLGGSLLSALGWQWIFAINLPLGILGVTLALRTLPAAHDKINGRFDSPGAVLSAVTMAALILAADACTRRGAGAATSMTVLAYAATAVIAGMAFIWRQRRASDPLLPLAMFSSARFSMAALTSLVSFIGLASTFIALPMLFQNAYGYSAFEAALLLTPWPLGIILAAPSAGRLADRYLPAMLATTGLGVFVIGLTLLALLPFHPDTPVTFWQIGWRELICGIGFGIFQSPNNREMMASSSRAQSSHASAVLAIVRTFGQCLGTALVGVLLSVYTHPVGNHADNGLLGAARSAHAVEVALWLAVATTCLALLMSAGRIRVASASG